MNGLLAFDFPPEFALLAAVENGGDGAKVSLGNITGVEFPVGNRRIDNLQDVVKIR